MRNLASLLSLRKQLLLVAAAGALGLLVLVSATHLLGAGVGQAMT